MKLLSKLLMISWFVSVVKFSLSTNFIYVLYFIHLVDNLFQ